MNYESTLLKPELIVDKIITIHYFEYSSHFIFPGETHDFWEFLYVDKGTVDVMAGSIPHTLNKGDIIFHQPNEFHSINLMHRAVRQITQAIAIENFCLWKYSVNL